MNIRDELRAVARDQLKQKGIGWKDIVAAGWPGLEVPEELDGAGVTFAETAVVLRELGRAAACTSFFGAGVLAVGVLNALEPSPVRDELLRGTASGTHRLTAVLHDGFDDTLTGEIPFRLGSSGLTGEARLVPDAVEATQLLVPASDETGALAVAVTGPGPVRPTETLDATRSFGSVHAEGQPVEAVLRFAEPGFFTDVLDRAALAVAYDSLGIAEATLAATVTHVKAREQFGRPLGSFQAVKHQCADLLVGVTVARKILDRAIEADDPGTAASMAKSYAGELGVRAAGTAMQLHGGMGYTWESGLHAYLKRAVLNRSLYGSPAAHRRRIAARYSATPSA